MLFPCPFQIDMHMTGNWQPHSSFHSSKMPRPTKHWPLCTPWRGNTARPCTTTSVPSSNKAQSSIGEPPPPPPQRRERRNPLQPPPLPPQLLQVKERKGAWARRDRWRGRDRTGRGEFLVKSGIKMPVLTHPRCEWTVFSLMHGWVDGWQHGMDK